MEKGFLGVLKKGETPYLTNEPLTGDLLAEQVWASKKGP